MDFKRKEIMHSHYSDFAPLRALSLRGVPVSDSYDPVMCPPWQTDEIDLNSLEGSVNRVQKSVNKVIKSNRDSLDLNSVYRSMDVRKLKVFNKQMDVVMSDTLEKHKRCWNGLNGVIAEPSEEALPTGFSDELMNVEVGELKYPAVSKLTYITIKLAQYSAQNELAQRSPLTLLSHPAVKRVRTKVIPYSERKAPFVLFSTNQQEASPPARRLHGNVTLTVTVFVPTRLSLKEFVSTVGASVFSSVISKAKSWDAGAFIAVVDKAESELGGCAKRPTRVIGQSILSKLDEKGIMTSTLRKYLDALHKEFGIDKYGFVGSVVCLTAYAFLSDLVHLSSRNVSQDVFRTAGYVAPLVRL